MFLFSCRQTTSNTLYLEGEVEELRVRLSKAEEREKDLMSIKVELGMVRSELEEYRKVGEEVLGTPGPTPLAKYLQQLQSSHLLATSQQSHLQAK